MKNKEICSKKNPKTNTVKIHAKVKNNNAEIKITTPDGKEMLLDTYNSIHIKNKRPKKYEIDSFITGLLSNEGTKEILLKNSEQEFYKWGDDKICIKSTCRIELELTGNIERKYRFDFVVESKVVEKEEANV